LFDLLLSLLLPWSWVKVLIVGMVAVTIVVLLTELMTG